MKILMLRHGEYGKDGNLTQEGIAHARKKGRELQKLFGPKIVKAYSSKLSRVVQTVENVLAGMERSELVTTLDSLGREGSFTEDFKKLYKADKNAAADLYLKGRLNLPGQITPKELAKGIAGVIWSQVECSGCDLSINGIHQLHAESLLVQMAGIENLSDIGGPMDYLEHMEFDFNPLNYQVKCSFRNKTYHADFARYEEIAFNGRLPSN